MQKYCSELTERLLKSLDKEYNVIDMGVVVDIISVLEKTAITKEVLEITRLGKHINELRRKTDNDALARRAKDLVRRWRDMVLPSAHSTPQPTPADTAPPALNGAKPHSPALRSLKPHSPALRGLKPQSPLLKDATTLRVLSPALSLHSDHSRSPNAHSNKQSIILNRISSTNVSPVFGSSSQNHTTEAVPRTHSSNKRLRKEDGNKEQRHYYQTPLPEFTQSIFGVEEQPTVKRQRHNGENISGNLNLQVPSPTLKERISSDRFAETSVEVADESGPKKRGRKKGSKSAKRQTLLDDRVKEKIASISRNPKLKTTQELLADLQARGANCSSSAVGAVLPSQSGVAEPPSMEDILRGNSSEPVSKYLRCSQKNSSHHKDLASETSSDSRAQVSRSRKSAENCRERSPDSCQERSRDDRTDVIAGTSTCRSPPRRDLTVEEILAKLPPLDIKSIDWSDCELVESTEERNGVECSPRPEPTVEDLERLQTQCIEGLNGNYQARLPSAACADDGGEQRLATNQGNGVSVGLSNTGGVKSVYNNNQTDSTEFREWHQMLARPSYQGETLHILPYVIID